MSDNEVLIIFHYDGEFVFDLIRPVYNGGRQKMRYLPRNISYGSLLNEALEASKWDTKIENLSMKYLHHNGRVFSLIILEDDNDIRGMLKASGNDQKGLYLYVNKSTNIASNQDEEHSRYVLMLKILYCTREIIIPYFFYFFMNIFKGEEEGYAWRKSR